MESHNRQRPKWTCHILEDIVALSITVKCLHELILQIKDPFLFEIMTKNKDQCENLNMKFIEAHQFREGYKKISKLFNISRSTVLSIVHERKENRTVLARLVIPRQIPT